MRMSRGASTAYEKPRSGRSICMLETPRSMRIASASTPFEPSWERTTESSPRRKRACTPASRSKRSKNGRTVASRSMAMKRPLPWRSAASTRACPPAPKVASTTASPGLTARSSRTSSARTGTWSVLLRCKALGNKLHTPFDLFDLLFPGRAIPDLHVVAHTGDDDLAAEACVLEQRGRHHHAALLVELGLGGAREHVAAHLTSFLAEGVEPFELRGDEGIPVVAGEHKETTVEPPRHDDLAREGLTEFRRESEPVLVVEGVLVFAE